MKRLPESDAYEFTLVIGTDTHVLRIDAECIDSANTTVPFRDALVALDMVLRKAKLGRVE